MFGSSGKVPYSRGTRMKREFCRSCKGAGTVRSLSGAGETKCKTCAGNGYFEFAVNSTASKRRGW